MDRRSFIYTSTLSTAFSLSPIPRLNKNYMKNDISLAQWALVDEIKAGKWKNLDFPRIAREDFNLNGIEFVNTLFEVPTEGYLKKLKANAAAHGVKMLLIMVDDEGDGASDTAIGRKQFEINHRKWIDIANYLGCSTVRTNCRAIASANKDEALKWAIESYQNLLVYAKPANINIVIENHGGVSNDADWMVRLMKAVNDPFFGTYPDWRTPSKDFDNVDYLRKTLPYAKGMSYRNQPTEELSAQMIKISQDGGYQGYFGIESSGREAIHQGIGILKKYMM